MINISELHKYGQKPSQTDLLFIQNDGIVLINIPQ